MKRFLWVLPLFLLFSPVYAQENFSFSGYLKNETSLRIEGMNNDLSKEKNIMMLAGQYKIKGDDLVLFTKFRYWYDAAYDSRDKLDADQHYMGHVQRTDWLRDCYLDYTNGSWFLRLGKQQVAWGQADGVTVLDRVNPLDLSEFWLPDFEDIRIPLWMANINYSPKINSNIQFLVIPDFEQSSAAPPGSPFAFRSTNLFGNVQKTYGTGVNTIMPPKKFENSTFALQWQDKVGDLTYTLNFLNGFYTTGRSVQVGTQNYYSRTFKRWRIYGSSFNKTFTNPGPMQGITLRGDFAYYNDEPTYYGDPVGGSTKGFKRWDNKFWILGVDKNILTRWTASFQFGQYIMEHAKVGNTVPQFVYPMNSYTYGPADPVENILTFKLSSHFLNDRLMPEVSWSGTDDNQGKLSPKINFEIKDNLWLTVGIHYFYGNEWDSNGQYRDQSQLYTNLKYTF